MASVARYCCCEQGVPCDTCADSPLEIYLTITNFDIFECGCLQQNPFRGTHSKMEWNAGFSNADMNTVHTLTQDPGDPCTYSKTFANAIQEVEHTSLLACQTDVWRFPQGFEDYTLHFQLDTGFARLITTAGFTGGTGFATHFLYTASFAGFSPSDFCDGTVYGPQVSSNSCGYSDTFSRYQVTSNATSSVTR